MIKIIKKPQVRLPDSPVELKLDPMALMMGLMSVAGYYHTGSQHWLVVQWQDSPFEVTVTYSPGHPVPLRGWLRALRGQAEGQARVLTPIFDQYIRTVVTDYLQGMGG